MSYIVESLKLPIDNLLGVFIYGVLLMLVTGLSTYFALRYIPFELSDIVKQLIIGCVVFITLLIWIFNLV
ncbi:hypothetical protein [Aquibacillus albus]|uniref:DUF2768 family protein n=1 Tax=Aquibacillus albus TaxID=1168171 RepID=A0ABS2N533_9BACI|nr:hypothetical protein [Aquibacillus albus]MBM7573227.1 hypothetical protein [Aquibacillus albus]